MNYCFTFNLLIAFLVTRILWISWIFSEPWSFSYWPTSFWENSSPEFVPTFAVAMCRPLPLLSYKSVGLTFWTWTGHSEVVCPCSPCARCPYLCPASLVPLTCVSQPICGPQTLLLPMALSIGMINNNQRSYYWLESKASLHLFYPRRPKKVLYNFLRIPVR